MKLDMLQFVVCPFNFSVYLITVIQEPHNSEKGVFLLHPSPCNSRFGLFVFPFLWYDCIVAVPGYNTSGMGCNFAL